MTRKIIILSLWTVLLGACHQHSHEIHDHDHEEIFLQIQAYSTNFEVFAEAEPFSTGHTSRILAHFTWLENFKPLEQASITLSLIVGNKGIRQTQEKALKPGIFAFTLKPEISGSARLVFDIYHHEIHYQIIVPHIQVYNDQHDAIHAAEKQMISSPVGIVFTKEQSWKVDFATQEVQYEDFGEIIPSAALIQPAPTNQFTITAKTNGMVNFAGFIPVPGLQVIPGQNLFSISSSGMAENNLQLRLLEAQNNFLLAKTSYERAQELAQDKIVSEKELQQARNAFDNAQLIYENLQNNFASGKQRIASPIAGFINQVYVHNGAYVEAGQAIVSITANHSLLLRADVPQQFLPILPRINNAIIRNEITGESFNLKELNGKIISWGRSTNTDNYLLPVNLLIDDPGNWAPGNFAEVFLIAPSRDKTITLPLDAIMEEQGMFYVFVQLTPELFEKREIIKGGTDGQKAAIIKGLAPQERVVSRGAIWVKLAESSAALDPHAGHVH